MKICLVVANYYPKFSSNLILGATKVLKNKGIKNYKILYTTGVFEIPIVISKKLKSYNAFIALGCVIKGKTPHFNFISKATINAIMNLSIKYKKPIGNGIITCLNQKQAFERSDPSKKNKGGETARAVLSVLESFKK